MNTKPWEKIIQITNPDLSNEEGFMIRNPPSEKRFIKIITLRNRRMEGAEACSCEN